MIFYTQIKEIRGEKEYLNITQLVIDEVKKSGVWEGEVKISPLHTTVGLIITKQEDEPGLMNDIKKAFYSLFPRGTYYEHDDFEKRTVNMSSNERKNASAHLIATFFTKTFETVPIKNGELIFGHWQSILFFDFDPKGREARNIVIQVIGRKKPRNGNKKPQT